MSHITDDLYLRLSGVATELTAELGRPVTIREALLRLLGTDRFQLGDFAWSWRFKELARADGKGRVLSSSARCELARIRQ